MQHTKEVLCIKTIPPGFNSKLFKLLFKIAEISNFTEDELDGYEESMRNSYDYRATIDYAKKTSRQEGVAKGRKEGVAIGKTRGIAIGRKEGVAIGKSEDAKSMLAYGLDPTAVARITKLPKKQILAMR
jgi:predicted transposase YdaD